MLSEPVIIDLIFLFERMSAHIVKINKHFSVDFIVFMQSVWGRSISPSCKLKKIAISSLSVGDTVKKSLKIKGKIEFPAWEGQMMEHSEFPRLLVCLGHLPFKLQFMSICHRLWSRHSLTTAIARIQVVLSFGRLSTVIGNGQIAFRTSLQIKLSKDSSCLSNPTLQIVQIVSSFVVRMPLLSLLYVALSHK